MSRIVYLANVPDAVTPTTIYGAGTVIDLTDEDRVRLLHEQGKVAMVGAEIRNPRVSLVGTTTLTIAWDVDQPCTAMKLDYGTTTAVSSNINASPTAGVGLVFANPTGLTTNTLYYYRISVTCNGVVTLSPTYSVRTL